MRQERGRVVYDGAGAVVREGVEVRAAADVRHAGQRRPAVVEGRDDLILRPVVYLARQVLVHAPDEEVAGVVRQIREGKGALEERRGRRDAVRRLVRRERGHVAAYGQHHLDEAVVGVGVAYSEQLDLVVSVELLVEERRGLADLQRAGEFGYARLRRLEVLVAHRRYRGEVGVGEEVDSLHIVVVGEARMNVRPRRGEGEVHLGARPDKRLDAPLLPQAPVALDRAVGPLGYDHTRQWPAEAP